MAQTPLVADFGKEPDDMIIIVSDGVSDYVSEEEMVVGLGLDLSVSEKLGFMPSCASEYSCIVPIFELVQGRRIVE